MSDWKTIRRKVRYSLIYFALRVLLVLSRLVPRKAWVRFFGLLGGMSYYLAPVSRRLSIKHLTMVYGKEKSAEEIRQLVKEMFVMLGRNGGDLIRAFTVSKLEELDPIRDITGIEHLYSAHARGKGVILLTAHIGAFEFIAADLSTRGLQPMIVGSPLKDERLNKLLWRQRTKAGAVAVERGKDTIKLIRNLKSGGMVIILIDQDTRVKSRFVNFFGIPCATPIGAALLAIRTGAAVVPMFYHLRNEDLRQQAVCLPEIPISVTGDEEADLVENTQRMNDVIEQEVRKYPSQWVWMHERWKTKPGEEVR